ncbi:unnamed protein product [Pseudo-nitzschia multistriata]|uniref:GST N-terminal domain-containing protein n=1 Tax=Pseudo-nitzschia multistriata TaxID=183589 RepID=A0A448Z320_9STRA|nr:unnamed protein product [Pseudo-nitzschia multistriata]
MAGRKLIDTARSRAFRTLWMLEEIGIPYQHVAALPQSEQARRYNPLGKIPVLVEDDGFSLYESGAILSYLGDRYRSNSGGGLVPRAGTRERAIYEQTMSVLLTELDAQGLWIHRKHEVMGKFFTYVPDAVEHARKYFHKTNRVLIQQLKDNNNNSNKNKNKNNQSNNDNTNGLDRGGGESSSFLLGSGFSAVDIVYVQCLDWSKDIGWNDKWKDNDALASYVAACKSRAAYARTLAVAKNEGKHDRSGSKL